MRVLENVTQTSEVEIFTNVREYWWRGGGVWKSTDVTLQGQWLRTRPLPPTDQDGNRSANKNCVLITTVLSFLIGMWLSLNYKSQHFKVTPIGTLHAQDLTTLTLYVVYKVWALHPGCSSHLLLAPIYAVPVCLSINWDHFISESVRVSHCWTFPRHIVGGSESRQQQLWGYLWETFTMWVE